MDNRQEARPHAVNIKNTSRTMLFDLENLRWDDDLFELFRVDRALLPTVVT